MNSSLRRGFTLIELLVVIAIIGLLASVVLASLNTARKKGRDARRISDIKQLQLAVELYYDSHSNAYPDVSPGLSALTPAFISVVPTDPLTGTAYGYTGSAADGSASCSTSCSSYTLSATMEVAVPANPINTTWGGVDCTIANFPLRYCVHP